MKINLTGNSFIAIKRIIATGMLWIICLITMSVNAQQSGITLDFKNVTLEQALDVVKKQTGFSIWYRNEEISLDRKVSIQVQNKDINSVLTELLSGQNLTYSIDDKYIVIFVKSQGGKPSQY